MFSHLSSPLLRRKEAEQYFSKIAFYTIWKIPATLNNLLVNRDPIAQKIILWKSGQTFVLCRRWFTADQLHIWFSILILLSATVVSAKPTIRKGDIQDPFDDEPVVDTQKTIDEVCDPLASPGRLPKKIHKQILNSIGKSISECDRDQSIRKYTPIYAFLCKSSAWDWHTNSWVMWLTCTLIFWPNVFDPAETSLTLSECG